IAGFAPPASLAGAVPVVFGADIFLARRYPFAVADVFHVPIERETRQDAVLPRFPPGAFLVPDAADLFGALVAIIEGRPVEVFVMDGRQPLDIHPVDAGIVRPDIDGGGEGNERELYRL